MNFNLHMDLFMVLLFIPFNIIFILFYGTVKLRFYANNVVERYNSSITDVNI